MIKFFSILRWKFQIKCCFQCRLFGNRHLKKSLKMENLKSYYLGIMYLYRCLFFFVWINFFVFFSFKIDQSINSCYRKGRLTGASFEKAILEKWESLDLSKTFTCCPSTRTYRAMLVLRVSIRTTIESSRSKERERYGSFTTKVVFMV